MCDEHVDHEASELVDDERPTANFVEVNRNQFFVFRPVRIERVDVGISCMKGSIHLNGSKYPHTNTAYNYM